jgi:MFS family permease
MSSTSFTRGSTTSLRSALMVPVLLLPTFMGFLDLWIMLVALPSIRGELHASAGAAQLMVGLYLTTYGAFLVLGGRLGDRYGRRRLLMLGVLVFTGSSALCMVAPDPTSLIVARGLQGVGAALMLPQVLSIIQVAVPAERRTAAIGAYSSVIGIAIVGGLMLGGALLQADVLGQGWRVLFAIKIPLGLVILPLLWWVVPESTVCEQRRLDVKGVALLSIALIVGLLSLEAGSDRGWSVATIGGLVVGIAVGAWFVLTELDLERRGGDPLVAPHLLREAPVRFGLAVTVLFYIATSGLFVVLPFLFQDALGLDPLQTGLAFAPLGVAFALSSLASRRSSAPTGTGPMVIGSAVMFVGVGAALLAAWQGGGTVAVAAPLTAFGFGAGMVFPQIVGIVLARVPTEDAGAASGVLLTATQASNALGVAIVGGVFTAAADLGTRDAFAIAALVALAFSVLVGLASAVFARNGRIIGVERDGQRPESSRSLPS